MIKTELIGIYFRFSLEEAVNDESSAFGPFKGEICFASFGIKSAQAR